MKLSAIAQFEWYFTFERVFLREWPTSDADRPSHAKGGVVTAR